ncbi:putative holin-like toxin [Streptococcus sp. E24BD]
MTERRSNLLTAFEVVQTILGFGMFIIALIGLCYKIFKDDKKK